MAAARTFKFGCPGHWARSTTRRRCAVAYLVSLDPCSRRMPRTPSSCLAGWSCLAGAPARECGCCGLKPSSTPNQSQHQKHPLRALPLVPLVQLANRFATGPSLPVSPSALLACSFCIEVSRTLVELGVPFIYCRLDQLDSGSQVSAAGGRRQAAGSSRPSASTALPGRAACGPARKRLYLCDLSHNWVGAGAPPSAPRHAHTQPVRLQLFPLSFPLCLFCEQIHEELKKATGQRTVPYVYIGGRLVGGCDATKALIASGEFDKLTGGLGE